jgi:hypothetical protein
MKYLKSLWDALVDKITNRVHNIPEVKEIPVAVTPAPDTFKAEPKVIATRSGAKAPKSKAKK